MGLAEAVNQIQPRNHPAASSCLYRDAHDGDDASDDHQGAADHVAVREAPEAVTAHVDAKADYE